MEAAMSSSLGAMGPLLRELDGLLVPECCRQAKLLKNEIELLKKDLEEMTTAFVELSEVETPNLTEKYWMGEVRELSYDIDDCIAKMTPVLSKKADTKGGSVHGQKVGRVKISRLPRTLKWSISIAKIAQLRTLVREASERHRRYLKPDSCRSSTASTFVFTAQRPVPTPPGQATRLVGIDKSRIDKTTTMLSKSDAKIRSRSVHNVPRLKIAPLSMALKRRTMIAEHMKTLVREGSERHEMYQQPDRYNSSSSRVFTRQRQVPTLYGEAANLVVIDDSTIELTKWLKNETEKQLKVVSIVGPGGIGKTTLAKHLYREFGGQFDCRAFVQASQKPNMRRLLAGILAQVQRDQRPTYACSVQNLIDNLSEHLQHKRYFIVIDDLWQTTTWDIVSSAFPEGNNCSTIITTMQIEDVALECCGYQSDYICKMKPLGIVDCEKIFFNRVFGSDYQYNKELAEISYGITTKCGGLPLATIGIASLLASQPDKLELRFRVQKCLWSTLRTDPTFEGMLREILNLCYNSLPHYLKTCLMYFSMYPEGYTILKANLVKQWIAEGFITELQGKYKEEVAESYFDELVNRGMIQPNRIKYVDGILSCTVHRMVLDIIMYKSKEENFTTTLDYPQTITGLTTKVRRLSLQLSSANHATKSASITTPQVRSLAFFGLLECVPSIVRFKLLRVLILELWGDHDEHSSFDLTGICRLFQLRYLKITCDVGVELPPQVKALRYLETLEVDARVIVVPSDIVHLPVLSHLRVGGETDLPDGIGHMTSLRTLQCFNISDNPEDNVRSLGKLKKLQDLHLTCSSTTPSDDHLQRNLVALVSSLGKLTNLSSLSLAPAGASSASIVSLEGSISVPCPPVLLRRLELLPPVCIFSRLPRWTGQLRKLCILKIVVRELLRNDIDSLNGLPALTVLSLDVQVARVGTVVVKHTSFPTLKYFRFRCRVLCLAFRAGAMPNLRKLKLCFNAQSGKQYGRMLAGVENLLSLQEIAGRIAAAAGAGESDRRAAESAFRDAIEASKQRWGAIEVSKEASDTIREHSPRSFPSVNVKWVDWDEEACYGPSEKPHLSQEGDLLSGVIPKDLLPKVMSFTTPIDACRSSAVCKAFRTAASDDEVWNGFFPKDYESILSRFCDPVDFHFTSTKKEHFLSLAEQPVLIDDGKMSFWLERTTGAKCYMISSRSLYITWGDTPRYWTWIPSFPNSRFDEVAELIDVCWLDIVATIDCRDLSLNTKYTAYLVFDLTDEHYGLDCPTQEATISIAGGVSAKHIVSLDPRTQEMPPGMQDAQEHERGEGTMRHPRERHDNWMEVELGEFYNANLDDGAVHINLTEKVTLHWKSGLIIEGVEIRPKTSG